jgi:3-oxoadipate enol-lactonase
MSGWFPFPDGAVAARVHTPRLSMFCVDGGSGPPVVLLHGLGWDSSLWFPTLTQLSIQHRAIAADTRGHGESDKPDGPYSIAQFADDWAALLDHLRVRKATLVGLSQGGMVAQALAISRPDLVARLVLVATSCRTHPDAKANMEARIAALGDAGPEAAAQVAAGSIFSAAWRHHHPEELARFLHWRCLAPAGPLTAAMRAVYGFDLSRGLPAIRVPTLVVAGSGDTLIPPAASHQIADLIPGAELHLLPDVDTSSRWRRLTPSPACCRTSCRAQRPFRTARRHCHERRHHRQRQAPAGEAQEELDRARAPWCL